MATVKATPLTLPTQMSVPLTAISQATTALIAPIKFGKSTWAACFENAIFLDTDGGLKFLSVNSMPINNHVQLIEAYRLLKNEKHDFKTVIVDTIDNAYRFCSQAVCRECNVTHEEDLGVAKGYGLVNRKLEQIVNALALLPMGIVFISHSKDYETKNHRGIKITRKVPTLTNKSSEIVLNKCDFVLHGIYKTETDPETQKQITSRVLFTRGSETIEAGGRIKGLPNPIEFSYEAFYNAVDNLLNKRAEAQQMEENK